VISCFGCGGGFREVDGPTHSYMLSSPGCWAIYGEVLAREYADYDGFGDVHRLTVDAFAAQHPHSSSGKNTRSVGFHLCRLCLMLERGLDAHRASAAMVTIAAQKSRFLPLPRPENPGLITVADVYAAVGPNEHRGVVRQWAAAVWQTWSPCHTVVRTWVDGIFPNA
jgi:Family of unknown function (DUF5946)